MATEQDKFDTLCNEYRETLVSQLALAATAGKLNHEGGEYQLAALLEALTLFVSLMNERTAGFEAARATFLETLGNLAEGAEIDQFIKTPAYAAILREVEQLQVPKEYCDLLLSANTDHWNRKLKSIEEIFGVNVGVGDVLSADTIE